MSAEYRPLPGCSFRKGMGMTHSYFLVSKSSDLNKLRPKEDVP